MHSVNPDLLSVEEPDGQEEHIAEPVMQAKLRWCSDTSAWIYVFPGGKLCNL